jgi:hypothetical protein
MLIKVEEKYIIDTKNKESLLKMARLSLNRGMEYELIETKPGKSGYYNGFYRVRALNTYYFISSIYNCPYSSVQTPYGKYTNGELSMYISAKEMYLYFGEVEKELKRVGALFDSGEEESDLSMLSCVFEPIKSLSVIHENVSIAQSVLEEAGIDDKLSEDELGFIYREFIHEYFRYEKDVNRNIKDAAYGITYKKRYEELRKKYKYLAEQYEFDKSAAIQEAKDDFWNC